MGWSFKSLTVEMRYIQLCKHEKYCILQYGDMSLYVYTVSN